MTWSPRAPTWRPANAARCASRDATTPSRTGTSVCSVSMSERWRLLLDPAAQGAWNMAVDEVLLEGVVAGTTPPTLRFYQWQPACLSLGYFQSFEGDNLDGCRAFGAAHPARPPGGPALA